MFFSDSRRPLIFGEVLFDKFSDGKSVLGGAPFNVAWNLKGFGLDPLFVSSVGRDREGDQIITQMESWGLEVTGLFRDSEYPTGEVKVEMSGDGHTFDILPEQAYDFIDPGFLEERFGKRKFSLLYHGSLITRSPVSRSSLQMLYSSREIPRFIDVNLREPWFDTEEVCKTIVGATWVKLNNEELETLSGSSLTSRGTLLEVAEKFREKSGIENLIVTMGEEGAVSSSSSGLVFHKANKVEKVEDTVGAGDAFSSVIILGISNRWTIERSMERAIAFASEICGIRGATSKDRSLYDRFLADWGKQDA
ncbi:MAG: PfkB family carbohydrate kinase [Nitrospinota bacterium]|nr:PfkB family carbohydrate kinase [Nitrospinota bacterium]